MFSDPSSRPSRSHGARLPALAIPHGVACRFRVFSVNRSSEGVGFFAPSLRFGLVKALRSLVFLQSPHCLARPRRLLPPAVLLPFRAFSRRSRPSPLDAGTSYKDFPAVRRIRSSGVHIPPKIPLFGLRFRIQGFSPSFRFTPPPALRVYFTPHPPFGFTLQGFPLPRSCANSSPAPCRLAVLHRLASRILVCGTSGAPSPQS